jgi:hypothetical protein
VVIALGLAACGDDDDDATADTAGSGDAEITLRLGYVTAPEHPYGIAIDNFIEEVTTASDGAIAIEALPNYQGGDVPLPRTPATGPWTCPRSPPPSGGPRGSTASTPSRPSA